MNYARLVRGICSFKVNDYFGAAWGFYSAGLPGVYVFARKKMIPDSNMKLDARWHCDVDLFASATEMGTAPGQYSGRVVGRTAGGVASGR